MPVWFQLVYCSLAPRYACEMLFVAGNDCVLTGRRSSASDALDICPLRTYTLHMGTNQPRVPLTPAVFYILLALAGGDKHGYQIMKQVKSDSSGQVKMGTGTLYGSLKRMLADSLIEEAGERPDAALDDERRRYYRLTDLGRRAFNAELRRYADVVAVARQRRLLPRLSVEGT
jgi:DNA-binding PadR family transcriptional regulator